MPAFGQQSMAQLLTCHEDLQKVFLEVVKTIDCTVLEGKRTKAQQIENVRKGVSQTLDSKHVTEDRPSDAVDVAPYPIDWNDRERFVYFAGFVLGVAARMGIPLRWGGDWNRDHNLRNQSFHDLPHFERVV